MSHIYRLLTTSGHWVKFQVGFVICYVPGTNKPSHYKVTFKILRLVTNVCMYSSYVVCMCARACVCVCVCACVHVREYVCVSSCVLGNQ